MDIAEVKEKIRAVTGVEAVIADPEVLGSYARDESLVQGRPAVLVVRPVSPEQVQPVIKLANQHKFGVVPISSGGPHHHGDTVPRQDNCIILDLAGLKRIIRLDRRNRVAMIEPGVTWRELIEAGRRVGLRPNLPLCPRPQKSVAGSCLERDPAIMPKYMWDLSDPLLCTELVWGSGNLFRTGSAAGPGSLPQQWASGQAQKNPMGPGQFDPLRLVQGAQGTMGAVTWVSVKMEILPRIHNMFLAGSDQLGPLTAAARQLQYQRLGDETLILNRIALAQLLAGGSGKAAPEIAPDLPAWALVVGLSGLDRLPEKRYAYQEKDARQVLAGHGLALSSQLGPAKGELLEEAIWSCEPRSYWKNALHGAHQAIFFLTTMDQAPHFIELMSKVAAEHNYPVTDLGVYLQPLIQGRCCHLEFIFPHEPKNREAMTALFTAASKDLAAAGAFFSRPYGPWNEPAFAAAPGTAVLWQKVKPIFDPGRVMNPGQLCY